MTGATNPPRERSLLAVAIERENWELAALCLLYGVVKAVDSLPQETLEALLQLLHEEERNGR